MVENCQITDIGLWFEGHGVCSLRVELSCNCAFHIELPQLNKFMRDFLQCFDGVGPVGNYDTFFVKKLKGSYVRAHFNDREKLIGLQHIVKDYGFDLTAYFGNRE